MKYLSSEPFVMPRPAKSTCCEACVWGRGEHADWCSEDLQNRDSVTITTVMTKAEARAKYGLGPKDDLYDVYGSASVFLR